MTTMPKVATWSYDEGYRIIDGVRVYPKPTHRLPHSYEDGYRYIKPYAVKGKGHRYGCFERRQGKIIRVCNIHLADDARAWLRNG